MSGSVKSGFGLLGLLLILAIAGPWIAQDPLAPSGTMTGLPLGPSAAHWLGTDEYTRDVFARFVVGARTSLLIAFLAVSVASAFGLVIGLLAGSSEGIVAQCASRLIDLALALPRVVVLLVVLAGTGALSVGLVGFLIGATGWPSIARLVNGETRRLRVLPWVDAARALGATQTRVLLKELLPGALPPVVVAGALGLADAILLEAALSFLGLGVRAPYPSWGGMIADASAYLATAPWLLIAPALALGLATTAATLLGDGLRRSLQPGSS